MATTIQEIREAKQKYLTMVQDEGKAILKKTFKEFFDASPGVKAVTWRQYTPYFNDGDPCEFSAHDFELVFKGDASKEDEGYGYEGPCPDGFSREVRGCLPGWRDTTDAQYEEAGVSKAAFETLKECHDDELLETVFGDHVEVTATREGFTVDEYDHE